MSLRARVVLIEKIGIISRFLCDKCRWIGSHKEMKKEQDIDYDQYCCPKCNNVMFDNGHGYIYCEKVN